MTTNLNNLVCLDRAAENKSSDVVYGLVEEKHLIDGKARISYGISAYADSKQDGSITVICSVHDVTPDKLRLQELVRKCNRGQLSAEHLRDVVEDFISA